MKNFGGNVRFRPRVVRAPRTEREVLAWLDEFRGRRIRAIGSLHSWSEAPAGDDVILDMRALNGIRLATDASGHVYAEIDAGCTIDDALAYLRAHGGYTLPTLGMNGRQTIAGAIATATHGSGLASLSHYASTVRVAGYSRDGREARIYEWGCGDRLLAARCGVGCCGIVLSVRIPVEPDYLIEEHTNWHDDIERILPLANQYPRQQFYLIPWSWQWFAQLRRPLRLDSKARPTLRPLLHRWLRLAFVDVAFNGFLTFASRTLQWWSAVRFLHRRVFPAITRLSSHAIDWSRHILMMRHDLYRHVEMELFVPAASVVHAAVFVEWVLRVCGGESLPKPNALASDDFGPDAAKALDELKGRYVHDHAITFRSVLGDETLISMTSGGKDAWYAISLVTYQRNLAPFLEVAGFVARAMAAAYGARPHWGKVCPLDAGQIAALYPGLPRFRACCAEIDPDRAFVNDFAMRVLGFGEAPVAAATVPGGVDLAREA